MKFRLVEHPAFEVAGWTLRTSCVDGRNQREIPAFWTACNAHGRSAALIPHAGPLGLIGLCAEWDESREQFTYVIGVEAAPGQVLPAGTRAVSLMAANYAVFESVGPMPDAIQNVWKQAFSEWLPSSPYQHAGTLDFEAYPSFPPGDPRGDITSDKYYCEVWIPVRAKA